MRIAIIEKCGICGYATEIDMFKGGIELGMVTLIFDPYVERQCPNCERTHGTKYYTILPYNKEEAIRLFGIELSGKDEIK